MAAAESGSPLKTTRMRRRALRAAWALAAAAWLLVARRPAAGAPWRAAEALLDALDRSAAFVGASASSKPGCFRRAKKDESFDEWGKGLFRPHPLRKTTNFKRNKFVMPRDYGDDGDPERPLYLRRALMLRTMTNHSMQDYVMRRHIIDTCGSRDPLRSNTTVLRDFFARLDAGQIELPELCTRPQLRRLRLWRKESDKRAIFFAWQRFASPSSPLGIGEKDPARMPKFMVAEFLKQLQRSGLRDPLRNTRTKFKKIKKTQKDKEVKEVKEAKEVKQFKEGEGERGLNEVKEVKEVKGIKGVEEVEEATRGMSKKTKDSEAREAVVS